MGAVFSDWQPVMYFLRFLLDTLTDFTRNNCPYIAAGIAYWTLFSLFPLALAAVSIIGFIHSDAPGQEVVLTAVGKLLPISQEYLTTAVEEVVAARGALGGIALVGLMFSGTAVFSAVRKGINHAWHIGKPHNFVMERLIDLGLLGGVVVFAGGVLVLTTNVIGVQTVVGRGLLTRAALESLALAYTFGAFLLMYRYIPQTPVAWPDTWLGALVGSLVFQGVRLSFQVFTAKLGDLNLVYGSLGALMAILMWSYLSALSLLLGAQLCYSYASTYGSRSVSNGGDRSK